MKQLVCKECKQVFEKKHRTTQDPKFCGVPCYMVTLKRKTPKEELLSVDTSCPESLSVKYLLIIISAIVAMSIFAVILGK
jgi:hypothetical protein